MPSPPRGAATGRASRRHADTSPTRDPPPPRRAGRGAGQLDTNRADGAGSALRSVEPSSRRSAHPYVTTHVLKRHGAPILFPVSRCAYEIPVRAQFTVRLLDTDLCGVQTPLTREHLV